MSEFDVALRLMVAALGTWRIAHLLAFEDGPFAVVARLRAAAGRFGGVLDCFHCLSLWAAAPLALWVAAAPLTWLCVTFGLSGAACLLQRLGSGSAVIMQPLSQGEDHHGMLRTDARAGREPGAASE
jgi:hypothetical protein